MFSPIRFINHLIALLMNALQPLVSLAARLFIASIFFFDGLTKIDNWQDTLVSFEGKYKVPYLPPETAAYVSTGAELVLPVLLVLGLLTRFSAIGLSILNAVAVISFSGIAPAAIQQHYLWGAIMLVIVFWGPGKLSADSILHHRYTARYY